MCPRATIAFPVNSDRMSDRSIGEDIAVVEQEIGLLGRIACRESQALSELYDRFAKVLFSIAIKILNDTTQAEEVLQEVFVQIWEKAVSYEPRLGRPMTWAIVLTRNKAIDHLRSSQRRTRLLDSLHEFTDAGAAVSETLDREVLTHELAQAVREALCALPSDQRCAIELAFFKGLTQAEVAAKLNEPLGTVKARIRRGMIQLRARLEGHLDTPSAANGREV